MVIEDRIVKIFEKVQYYIQKYTPIYILVPHNQGIGNSTEEMLIGLLHARRKNKKILFLRRWTFRGNPTICNKELFRLKSPYILDGLPNIIGRLVGNTIYTLFLGHPAAFIRYFLTNVKNTLLFVTGKQKLTYMPIGPCFSVRGIGVQRIWIPEETLEFSPKFKWTIANQLDWGKEWDKGVPEIKTRKSKQAFGKAQLRKMGIKEGDWYVCLHNREGGFKHDPLDYRNNDINTYIKSIKAITDAGGWVVRLGDKSMTPLPKMERVVDYPFSEFKSEFMDMYLVENCRFFFGQNAGIASLAILMSKKCVLVNMTEWITVTPKTKGSIMIFKHQYDEKRKKYFALKDLMKEPFTCQQDFAEVRQNRKFQENSPEEILTALNEMMHLDGKPVEYTALQNKFNQVRKEQIRSWLKEDEPLFSVAWPDRFNKYRFNSHVEGVPATLATEFITLNWEENSLNTKNQPNQTQTQPNL